MATHGSKLGPHNKFNLQGAVRLKQGTHSIKKKHFSTICICISLLPTTTPKNMTIKVAVWPSFKTFCTAGEFHFLPFFTGSCQAIKSSRPPWQVVKTWRGVWLLCVTVSYLVGNVCQMERKMAFLYSFPPPSFTVVSRRSCPGIHFHLERRPGRVGGTRCFHGRVLASTFTCRVGRLESWNAVINHATPRACRPQRTPGELRRTQRRLCVGETQVIVRHDAEARRGGSVRVDFVPVLT